MSKICGEHGGCYDENDDFLCYCDGKSMNLECTPPINEFPMVMKIQVDSPVDENFSSLSGIYAMGKGKNILKYLLPKFFQK